MITEYNCRNMIFGFNPSLPSAAYMSVNRISIGSDNGLSPIRRLAIILINHQNAKCVQNGGQFVRVEMS